VVDHLNDLVVDVLAGWDIHLATAGDLTPWSGGPLDVDRSHNNLWCRSTPNAPWSLDITIGDGDDGHWIYRRDTTIRVAWPDAVLVSSDGIPYLAPELQLLFKSTNIRPKDDIDASVTMPLLEPRRRSWLASHLPAAHSWQATIAEVRARRLAEQHLGRRATTELLAAGNSSQAWLATLDHERWVIRIPIPNSGRSMSYRSEASIGSQLAAVGHPVSDWTTVEVDHELCCFGPRLAGGPISYGEDWTEQFAAELGSLLHDLHHLPASGFGPLEDTEGEPRGCSSTAAAGIVARWFHAPIWPFDDTQFSDHPLTTIAPELAERIRPFRADIVDAAAGPHGIVHSDLHRHHLLVEDGHLSGVLYFGDAFVGSTAWDFALLHWYYGEDNTRKVAAAYPSGVDEFDRGRLLAAAVGCYKLARSPDDRAVLARLRAVVDGLRG
jgi:aminoglycoside phosphotransferase (APT) family kinase protein